MSDFESNNEDFESSVGKIKSFILKNKAISLFLTLALIGWLSGMASLQIHEASVKREVAAAKAAEEKAQAERLLAINKKWDATKFAKWQTFSEFSYIFPGGQCSSTIPCTHFTLATKYNCSSIEIVMDWLGNDGAVVETTRQTEDGISSLESRDVYVEMSKSAKVKSVEFKTINCVDKEI